VLAGRPVTKQTPSIGCRQVHTSRSHIASCTATFDLYGALDQAVQDTIVWVTFSCFVLWRSIKWHPETSGGREDPSLVPE
jgi:hypothetical protein